MRKGKIKKRLCLCFVMLTCFLCACKTGDMESFAVSNMAILNLNDYITLSLMGNNGEGYASVKGYSNFETELLQKTRGELSETQLKVIKSGIIYKIEECDNGKLSNGDIVTITIQIDEDVDDEYGVLIIGEDMEISVSDLPEKVYEEIDPFGENFYISYEGISPYIKVKDVGIYVQISGLGYYNVKYPRENNELLSNGDTIIVDYIYKSEIAEEYDVKIISTEKEFLLEGHNSYLQTIDEINKDDFDKLVSDAKNQIWVLGYGNIPDAEFCGTYFLTAKNAPTTSGDKVNKLYCVFKADIDKTPYDLENIFVQTYFVIGLSDIAVDETGKLVYNKSNMGQVGTDYSSLDKVYEDIVVKNNDDFDCEKNLDLE